MANTRVILVLAALIAVVCGQKTQQLLWPPKCCLGSQLKMTFRGVVGDMVAGKSFGYSNLNEVAIDFDKQLMGYIGVVKFTDGTAYEYKTIQDYNKQSTWSISEGSCTWLKTDGNMGRPCIAENNGESVFFNSFNYLGYIPTYTWRITYWQPTQKGFLYISVTEDECLPVTSNFGGYNDQVVPNPETVFSGGNFYNYSSGISDDDRKRFFEVPSRCPPAPPPDFKPKDFIEINESQTENAIFAPAKVMMDIRNMIRHIKP